MSSSPSPFPMPHPTVPNQPFPTFKILSFDIFGTLIDWESSIIGRLKPLVDRLPRDSPHAHLKSDTAESQGRLWAVYKAHESSIQSQSPALKYPDVLAKVYRRIASEWGISADEVVIDAEAVSFAGSIGTWLAFPDTVDAMKRLARHYRLVPLSNVAREPFARTRAGPLAGVPFWRVYTAEDVGSYKPDLRNFEYLLKHLDEDDKEEGGEGVRKEEVLHVAQSLYHDHEPARKMGISSCWIDRQGVGDVGVREMAEELHESGKVGYGWRFKTLGQFADEVEEEWEGRES